MGIGREIIKEMIKMELVKVGFRKYILSVNNNGIEQTKDLREKLSLTFPKIRFVIIGNTIKP